MLYFPYLSYKQIPQNNTCYEKRILQDVVGIIGLDDCFLKVKVKGDLFTFIGRYTNTHVYE